MTTFVSSTSPIFSARRVPATCAAPTGPAASGHSHSHSHRRTARAGRASDGGTGVPDRSAAVPDENTTARGGTGGHGQGAPVVAAPPRWRRPACAPGLRFTCHQAEVIIRYRYAGRTRELRVPTALWSPFVEEVRHGRLDRLAPSDGLGGWTPWGAGGGEVARALPDEVIIRHGAAAARLESRLPAIIWDQILVAVRAHAVDDLDARGDAEGVERRSSGFRTMHGSALTPPRSRDDGPDRSRAVQPRSHLHHPTG
ncbi:hypothetical protein [Frankia sp. AgKG'84/4]